MLDLLTVGEILIDLTQTGVSDKGICQYAANPGGAPANAAVAAAKLGCKAGFLGKVGKDAFGNILRTTLQENNVDVKGLLTSDAATTLAVVSVDGTGERSFSFYRHESADTLLSVDDVREQLKETPRILHFGSVSLAEEPERSATLEAVKIGRENGAVISYDPNYRASLWRDEATAVAEMRAPLTSVDILKISDEEVLLVSGEESIEEGSKKLCDLGIKIVLITLGDKGTFYRMGDKIGVIPGYKVKVADTNGAGDTFFGAFLCRLLNREKGILEELDTNELEEHIRFANLAASITCTRSGAIPAMPTLDEVLKQWNA